MVCEVRGRAALGFAPYPTATSCDNGSGAEGCGERRSLGTSAAVQRDWFCDVRRALFDGPSKIIPIDLQSLKLIDFHLLRWSAQQRLFTVLGALTSMLKTSAQLRLENLALRQQLAVLRRSAPKRLKLTPADRIFWVWLRRVWSDWKSALMIVKAETVVAWHRKGFRLFWTWKIRRGKPGRPSVPQEVRDLIRMMSRNNPRWGAPRIHGELLKLGIEITEPTVAKYMVRHRKPPSQTWRTFLDNHCEDYGVSRLLHRADDPVPGPVRVSGAGARPAAHSPLRRDGSSDCGVDGPATSRGLSMGQCASLSAARS